MQILNIFFSFANIKVRVDWKKLFREIFSYKHTLIFWVLLGTKSNLSWAGIIFQACGVIEVALCHLN